MTDTVTIAFRVTLAVRDRVVEAAQAQGRSLSDFGREAVLRTAAIELGRPNVKRGLKNAAELRALVAELGRLGNNLNQAVRILNVDPSSGVARAAIARMQDAHIAILTKVAAAIGGTDS